MALCISAGVIAVSMISAEFAHLLLTFVDSALRFLLTGNKYCEHWFCHTSQ